MVRPSWILAVFVLFTSPLVATADEPASSDATSGGDLFTQLDENQDGQLAADEIPEDRRSLFDRLLRIGDANKDGQLNGDEFAAGLAGGRDESPSPTEPEQPARPDREGRAPGALFERLDANGDGKVELDEVPEPGRERFSKLLARVDKDGDGAVTRREFAEAGPGAPAKKGNSKKPGDAAKKPNDAAKKRPPQAAREPGALFQRMDRNSDGKLTADEVPEERKEMLQRMIQRGDKDGDSSLSLEEFKTVFAKRGQPPRPAGNPGPPKKPGGPGPMGLFVAIDTDRDGELDSAEIAAAEDSIRKLDKNGDGTVSAREVLAGGGQKKNQKQMKKKEKKNKKKKSE